MVSVPVRIRPALSVALAASGAALITVCSWISLPVPPVPFTLQTFAVCLCAGLLPLRLALMSVCVYIALGAVGVPVFAGFHAGLAGPAAGYVVGFVFTALTVSLLIRALGTSVAALAFSMAVGILLCYAFGTAWFLFYFSLGGKPVGLLAALEACVLPFLLPDAAKIAVACLLVRRLRGPLCKMLS